jgi:coenzyme F420-reducing hydrogenase alpha subunit
MNEGRLVSNRGLDIDAADFEQHFVERQVDHSTALHAERRTGGSYVVGPLARFALNFDRLSPLAREAAEEAGLGPDERNPFRSLVVRAVEILYACDEALRILREYEPPDAPAVPFAVAAGEGAAITEAPRGILYHRYRFGADGLITQAKIVPPTSQNQRSIERDLERLVGEHLDWEDGRLQWLCEQAIRNYDPCISCATHFLKLRVDRA